MRELSQLLSQERQNLLLIFQDGVQAGLVLEDGGLILLNRVLVSLDFCLIAEDRFLIAENALLVCDHLIRH
jgi:hypothetical protein